MLAGGLLWGWTWLAGVGVIILLGAFLLPWFFFLLNLQTLLTHLAPENRRMSPGLVWLNFIPLFQLGWFVYTVMKVRDSVAAEFKQRCWYIDGDLGYNVGLTAGILWIASVVIGWIPFIGWVLPLGGVVCWIIYWLKTADLRNRLDAGPAWNRPYLPMYPPAYPPYSGRSADQCLAPAGPQRPDQMGGPSTGAAGPAACAPSAPSAPPPGTTASPRQDGEATGVDDDTTEEQEARDYRCAACGAPYDKGDSFCRNCGLRLP